MWKEYVSKFLTKGEFSAPVLPDEIVKVEKELKVKFPEELTSLFLETNGVKDVFKSDLIWPLERIRKDNLFFRGFEDFKEIYMPFDHLLFFADSGTGDQFAYSILNKEIRRTDVFAWNHEDDSRKWVASSMKQYIEWWLTDKIHC
jgi:hypothetical protein